MRLSEAGELGLLRELESRGLIVGTEHDAAELADGLVVTQDALVEGVHFRLDWISWRELGYRAAAVNLSDLSASGARPEALFVTLALPGDVELERVLELYEGFADAGVPVRGGDTSRAGRIVVSVTALGRADRVPGRAGARPGHNSSSPARSAPPAPLSEQGRYVRPPLADRGRAAARRRGRRDARRLGRDRGRRRAPRAPLRLSPRRSTSTPCRWGASWTTSASARTSSCSPRRPIRSASRSSAASRRARASSCSTTASRTTCRVSALHLEEIAFSRTKLT